MGHMSFFEVPCGLKLFLLPFATWSVIPLSCLKSGPAFKDAMSPSFPHWLPLLKLPLPKVGFVRVRRFESIENQIRRSHRPNIAPFPIPPFKKVETNQKMTLFVKTPSFSTISAFLNHAVVPTEIFLAIQFHGSDGRQMPLLRPSGTLSLRSLIRQLFFNENLAIIVTHKLKRTTRSHRSKYFVRAKAKTK